jgi:hypothetical protein
VLRSRSFVASTTRALPPAQRFLAGCRPRHAGLIARDGADLSYDGMLDVYLAERETDPVMFRRALVAAELGILLFGWPEYAAYRAQDAQERLARRLIDLTDCWLSDSPL